MVEKYREHYKSFLDAWGYDAQALMVIEEMSELTKEICKRNRKRKDYKEEDLIEEIADVLNMVEQLEYYFGEEKVEKVREQKIQRTLVRLKQWKEEQGE